VSTSSFKNIKNLNKGSVLYYSNFTPWIFSITNNIKFSDTKFESCQAAESGVIFANSSTTLMVLDKITASGNKATGSNSFG
jgi:hypothetical protein